jgi:hypothetical protein
MIVQPDFLDHWKTELLIDLLNDPAAPLYVIRLWAHCQNRKTQTIPSGNPNITKAICKASNHDAKKFHDAMLEAGFIEEQDGELIAHGWGDINATLLRNWNNGAKGGRPPKKNPAETQRKPSGNPAKTQPEPIRLDKSRVDKSRVETTSTKQPGEVDDVFQTQTQYATSQTHLFTNFLIQYFCISDNSKSCHLNLLVIQSIINGILS